MKERGMDFGEISGFLDEGTDFQGELRFRETMRIDGKFNGKIFSKNVLIIGESAKIEGDIEVSNISINGQVKGKLVGDKKVEIHSRGRVYGDIITPSLIIEDGAFFHGKCDMDGGAFAKDAKDEKIPSQPPPPSPPRSSPPPPSAPLGGPAAKAGKKAKE